MFSPEQIEKLLEDAKPQVIESLKKELLSTISWEAQNECAKVIREHVHEWLLENVIPDITKSLIESKDSLISLGVNVAPAVCEKLAEAMTTQISEKLNSDWKRREILETLFKA